MKRLRANQGGMTLLEILAAVFVLALVAVPLLNMFVFNTKLVANAKDMGDTTYAAQAVMEDLQPLKYDKLYLQAPLPGATGSYQIKSVNSSAVYVTKNVKIDRYPYGAFNDIVSGTACYAHLIIGCCSATFTCPDGKSYTGLSYTCSPVNITSAQVTIGGKTYSLNKPAGSNMILIINAGSDSICSLNVNLNGTAACVLYALSPADTKKQNITVNGSTVYKEYRKYLSATDPVPATMLVNALCTVYKADGTVASTAQNTLQVNLP